VVEFADREVANAIIYTRMMWNGQISTAREMIKYIKPDLQVQGGRRPRNYNYED